MSHKQVIGIVDYQAGNLQSLENAFTHIGGRVERVSSEKQLQQCTHLVLPGVGAFGFCANRLTESSLIPSLEKWAFEDQKPLLGICVGMQLLGDNSEESLGIPGLGWLGGGVKRMPTDVGITVPHVGWNRVEFATDYGSLRAGEQRDFYFDHSFAYDSPLRGQAIGHCMHGVSFCAIIGKDNITGVQFHPEKSQNSGLQFLKEFLLQC